MNDWFYTKARQQYGPVSLLNLQMMIRDGALDPVADLAWNASMPDWLPIGQIPALGMEHMPASPIHPAMTQPFAYALNTGPIQDIEPGSERIMATACLKRSWDLTIRHIGYLLLASFIFVAIIMVAEFSLSELDEKMGWKNVGQILVDQFNPHGEKGQIIRSSFQDQLSPQSSFISMIINVFLALGATRLGLKVVSGEKFHVGMLFSGAPWLLKALVTHILYWIMVFAGLILFIFPGIYLALRFGMAQTAIVDRNMGIFEAFKYSAQITKNNRGELFLICIFMIGLTIAGCIALIVGLLFAYPVIFLMWIIAYRWMQYGARAILDDPMTGQPMLAGHTEKAKPSTI